ncbi:hypothetical protein CDO44_21315 [Pigmentiphaga sp. NML080357]|uniref:hypothetical protein n=1 Tax=Pigmentiphaga sp. NML080357 TaxID=2008675 RepID=UPI000B417E24|nr:hypothetical protein [Pigmentiphaga sp. NML080357]OVZ56349.1 hypothetical protein CDO44_21315 [Pigmentiphaga sp. NML080357]
MEDWTPQARGWVNERNFEIDTAPGEGGYQFRVRVLGFPLMQDGELFPSADAARAGAIAFLERQFQAKVEVE